jgi:signal transduction histidine kinase
MIISIMKNIDKLEIQIRDNGVGNSLNKMTQGTGKGLKLMEEMIVLYKKLTGHQVTYEHKINASGAIVKIGIETDVKIK